MVRKAVRTYSQIVNDFAKADEEDARIRAFYEPAGAPAAVRPSADPDTQKRPISATQKHRYAHMLDWSDDISAIVNVDKHDGGARAGAPAAAFAADRKGNASRALTAALNCAIETASRRPPSPAPPSSHSSRLAMRLLRAAQAPLPMPATSPPASATTTPRPDAPPSASASTDPHAARAGDGLGGGGGGGGFRASSPSRPGSPPSPGCASGSGPVPSGSAHLDMEEQQQLAIASGTLLSSNARMLYYGSAKPRASSARGRPGGLSPGRRGGSRPVSAPSQQSTAPPPSSSSGAPYTLQLQLPLGRAALTATWAPSPASSRSRPASARPAGTRANAAGASFSPPISPSSVSSTRHRSSRTAVATTPLFQAVGSAAPMSPASARHSLPRSSFSSFVPGLAHGDGGGDGDESVVDAATARSLGMKPGQLHQTQPKHGPSNGLVVRDPVGPQLVPNRRVALARPFSAPPGGGPGALALESPVSTCGGGGGVAQQAMEFRPPSPSWVPPPRQPGASPSPRQRLSPGRSAGGSGNGLSPRRQAVGGGSPPRGDRRREVSLHSPVTDGPTAAPVSQPSCASVAVAVATAAAAAAVNSVVTLARRRHAALDGARKALWSQIADAAGVAAYEIQDPEDGGALDAAPGGAVDASLRPGGVGAVAAGSSPYLAAYLAQQQAAAGASSCGSSRAHSRLGSPDHLKSLAQGRHHVPLHGSGDSDGGFGVEPSAACLAAAASAAAVTDTDGTEGAEAGGYRRASEPEGSGRGDGCSGEGGEGSMPRRANGQGSVLRVASIIKRAHGGGGGDDDAGDGAATTPAANKRVQWGTNMWAPRPQRLQMDGHDAVMVPELLASGAPPPLPHPGSDLGRPPRYPGAPPALNVGGAAAATAGPGSGGEVVFVGGPISPVSSISPAFLGGGGGGGFGGGPQSGRRPRPPSRLQERDRERASDDGDGDLPSLEVSTAAGVLDRPHLSPRAAAAATAAAVAVAAAAAPRPLPAFTEPEFYHMTALVDRAVGVQGWLFNVYLTDIAPGNPVARRVCIATCTTADEHKQLLVPRTSLSAPSPSAPSPSAPSPAGPSIRRRPASASAALLSSTFPLVGTASKPPASSSSIHPSSTLSLQLPPPPPPRPPPPTPLISPVDLLPWVSRPEQLFGHWLRLEAFAIAPVADKVIDAMTYMGRMDTDAPPPPPQPKISRLQITDVRPVTPTPAAAAPAAAGVGAGGAEGAGGVQSAAVAAALGRQQLSSAGSAALMQARLAAEAALPGRTRPASARRGPSWA